MYLLNKVMNISLNLSVQIYLFELWLISEVQLGKVSLWTNTVAITLIKIYALC